MRFQMGKKKSKDGKNKKQKTGKKNDIKKHNG